MGMNLISQEKISYVLYPGVLVILGSIFAVGGLYVLMSGVHDSDLPRFLLSLFFGGLILVLAIWLIAKGFSRQRFRLYREGFIPFWKGYFDSRTNIKRMTSWDDVLFVAQVDERKTVHGKAIWKDFIIVRNFEKVLAYVIEPSSMQRYDKSTIEHVQKISGEVFDVVRAKSFSDFQRYLRQQGISPEVVDYQIGEFEVPAIPG